MRGPRKERQLLSVQLIGHSAFKVKCMGTISQKERRKIIYMAWTHSVENNVTTMEGLTTSSFLSLPTDYSSWAQT